MFISIRNIWRILIRIALSWICYGPVAADPINQQQPGETGRRNNMASEGSATRFPLHPHHALLLSPSLCRFNTTKEGMKKGAAARQLKIEHKVTDAMMTNSPEGSYRFKKDKQEN